MPELPEVETIRKGIIQKLKGKKIQAVEIRVSKLFIGDKKEIVGATIISANRHSKILEIVLDNEYSILIHLKMTGQSVFEDKAEKAVGGPARNATHSVAGGHPEKACPPLLTASGAGRRAYEQPLPHKHTHIIYTFSDGSKLYFNDLRKFGWNRVLSQKMAQKYLESQKFGPEPFSKDFNTQYLKKIFAKTIKKIKEVLSDQTKISGLGNIYSNEALYYAGINPTRLAKSLDDKEIKKLKSAIEKVIKLGLEKGGTSENTYVNIEGKKGQYMEIAAVYQQEKDPKGHQIKKIKIGERTAHFCPKCQK